MEVTLRRADNVALGAFMAYVFNCTRAVGWTNQYQCPITCLIHVLLKYIYENSGYSNYAMDRSPILTVLHGCILIGGEKSTNIIWKYVFYFMQGIRLIRLCSTVSKSSFFAIVANLISGESISKNFTFSSKTCMGLRDLSQMNGRFGETNFDILFSYSEL